MRTSASERYFGNWLPAFSVGAGIAVAAIGAVALIGWAVGSSLLTRLIPWCVAMNPLTSLAFVLSGVSLWRLAKIEHGQKDSLAMIFAGLVTALSLVRLAQFLFSFDFHIDQILFASKLGPFGAFPRNEMPPNTALCFFYSGLALLLFDVETRRGFRPAQVLSLAVGLISLLILLGYCYRAFSPHRSAVISSMALGSAIAFELFCIGALAARPNRGAMVVLTSSSPGGSMARRLLPMAVLVPAILGILVLRGEKARYFEIESGVSIFATSAILVFTGLIWWNARLLYQADIDRKRAERRLTVQYNCTLVLALAADLGEALPRILKGFCEALGWPLGAAWMVDTEHKMLRCVEVWRAPSFSSDPFVEATRNSSFSIGEGLPGRVWSAVKPLWLADLAKEQALPRGALARAAGLHGAFAFPVLLGSEVFGVVEFFSSEVEHPDNTLIEMLSALGSQIGQFIERQRAEQQLRSTSSDLARSNTDLQQFAYVASHDLFEPLRMVVSFLQLLQDRSREKLDKQSQEFIGFAIDGAHRMQALINDLLAYSRVDLRARKFEPVNCELVFDGAVANLKVAIEENRATITHDPLPTVLADVVQLTQVFQNLIGNAIKFHGTAPPIIHASARQQDHEWLFNVRDNGIGIGTKHFDRIFEIFQRLHTRQEYTGTGMGLAICKKIIERHGGKIWVESRPGEGSTFLFTLPLME